MNHLFVYLGGMGAVAQSASGALIAGLWESALLVAGVWLVLRVVPQTTAAVRFAIWTAVFCVSAAMPFAGVAFGTRMNLAAATAVGQLRVDARWSYLIAAVWVLAAVARVVQLAVQGWRLRTLWKQAVPVADDALAAAGCEDLLAGRRVRVCRSEDVDRPSVIGFFAPRILVPAWLFEQMSAVELRHIVLHEMEHLRRRDDWMNLLQKIGLVVFPLNPALFWVDRRLAAEREIACDDGVLRRTQMPRAYATCLASIAEMRLERRMHRRVVALALGVLGVAGVVRGRSEFSRRIESILGRQAVVSPRVAAALAAVLMAAVLGAGVELARVPELVSFGPSAGVESVGDSAAVLRGSVAGGRVQQAAFRGGEAREADLVVRAKSGPQRLKPQSKGDGYGTAEAVPLSKAKRALRNAAVPLRISGLSDDGEADVLADQATAQSKRVKEQWMVLTSFEEGQDGEEAPARGVVLSVGDGRFYVVPIVCHAAVPMRDGWLIVQL